MFGSIKGFKINELKLSNLDKYNSNKIDEFRKVLEDEGRVYVIHKNFKIMGSYVFVVNKEDRKILILKEINLDKEIKNLENDFNKAIEDHLREFVAYEKYNKILFNENEIIPNSLFNLGCLPFSLLVGIVYGIIFNNLALGICLGIVLAPLLSVTIHKIKK